MTNLKQKFDRLAELERVRKNLQTYSHYDDLGPTMALALKYVGGTVQVQEVIGLLASGLDAMIAEAKNALREDLK